MLTPELMNHYDRRARQIRSQAFWNLLQQIIPSAAQHEGEALQPVNDQNDVCDCDAKLAA